jgi:hypothetical protein
MKWVLFCGEEYNYAIEEGSPTETSIIEGIFASILPPSVVVGMG